jgi:hypothetical protein
MSTRRLLGQWALAVALSTSIACALTPTAGASVVPGGGVIEVTGYAQVSVMGSHGPVTVVVNKHQAASIRRAMAGLAVASASFCMETSNAFSVSFLAHKGARTATLVATEDDCPTPGVVSVKENGRAVAILKEDCVLRAAVLAALPPGQAECTRQDENRCTA